MHLDKLEALNILGVRASYMAAFKDHLREEGITPSDEVVGWTSQRGQPAQRQNSRPWR